MRITDLLNTAGYEVRDDYARVEKICGVNQGRVLRAFQEERVSDYHLHGSTGYGYGDSGREVLERVYAHVFGGEKALVRSHFASGTHALACALFGLLRPGDELLIASGEPYDTLHQVIGLTGAGKKAGNVVNKSSLAAWGVSNRIVPLLPQGGMDLTTLRSQITPRTKVVYIQRSRGYNWRKALTIEEIAQAVRLVKQVDNDIACVVDNCYGEFVEESEPCHVGADLAVGSLIKNPGGGLALSGAYIVGSAESVELAAERLYAPGIGDRVGASTGFNRGFLQGLFLAPSVVEAALKGAILLARSCEILGLETSPAAKDKRSDIIQAVRMPSREKLIAFCQAIQASSPIDSHVTPEPGSLPGYDSEVIMAAGTFVLGASSELSADAPLREPFTVYVQGGLSFAHVRIAIGSALLKAFPELVSGS